MNKDLGSHQKDWWKYAVFYHIYPLSFKDTNNDGFGDIKGIIDKLDYLVELGIDALWLSPIYPSPMDDYGYDITNHTAIDPVFGSMYDFELLLCEAHEKGIKIILDLVLNHTSDKHPWFLESKSSANNPKHDWYLWQAPRNNKKPNNWKTNFGRSAWEYNKSLNKYYYHSFFKEQPDLNWRNEDVKKAMFSIVEFWLNKGVDGFRLDIVNLLIKDENLKNNNTLKFFSNNLAYNRNQPETFEVLREFRQILNRYENKTSVGEIYLIPPGDSKLVSKFLGNGNNMLHLAFDFSICFKRWSAKKYYKAIHSQYEALPAKGNACFVLSNHDLGRHLNRFGITFFKEKKAKLLAALLLTLKGTPFIYYGDELGLHNIKIKRKDIRDKYGKMLWPFYCGRDGSRTPMLWDDTAHAGFSGATPWLPVHKNYKHLNKKAQSARNNSVLNTYKTLIQLRKEWVELSEGNIDFIRKGEDNILIYSRQIETQKIIVVLNFSLFSKTITIRGINNSRILFSTVDRNHINDDKITLYPLEASILII